MSNQLTPTQIVTELFATSKAEREKAENEKMEKERIEAEKLAKAPVKQQLFVWMQLFQKPNEKPTHEVATEIEAKFEAFKKWALSQIENI